MTFYIDSKFVTSASITELEQYAQTIMDNESFYMDQKSRVLTAF